ncbi:MAG: alpha/beta fold hydrolase [Sphingobacterium sp.]
MKILYILLTASVIFVAPTVFSQTLDTLVDVGTHKLHFRVMPGKGLPIVFESGGGNDGSVWGNVMRLLREQTDAPLIAYDRAGFGESEIDTMHVNIINEVKDLQTGLKKLVSGSAYFFVAHSLGGNYAMKFISDRPSYVKGAVFIDVVSPYFMTEVRAANTKNLWASDLEEIKKESIGFYHLALNYECTSRVLRNVANSIEIPLTVIASGKTPFEGEDRKLFLKALKRFAMDRKNRKYILVEDADHYVFYDQPHLVVDEIINLYNTIKEP